MGKFDHFCNVRNLTLDNMVPDLSNCMEELGKALSVNKKMVTLYMRNNKIKQTSYGLFWLAMCGNQSLKKMSVSKTDLNDKVVEKLQEFLKDENTQVNELDLSKNSISDQGMKSLTAGLTVNKSITKLNLESNMIRSDGTKLLAQYL